MSSMPNKTPGPDYPITITRTKGRVIAVVNGKRIADTGGQRGWAYEGPCGPVSIIREYSRGGIVRCAQFGQAWAFDHDGGLGRH